MQGDTEIVFADLEKTGNLLLAERTNASEVRRLFGSFVVLTQKLTAAMRRDFSRTTGKKWKAGDFTGWNEVTEFFKVLRNSDLHDLPVRIEMRHFKYLPIRSNDPRVPKNLYLEFSYEQVLPTQLAESAPNTATIEKALPDGSKHQVPWEHPRQAFIIQARTHEIKKALANAKMDDVHELMQACLASLRCYHDFFVAQLAGARFRI